VIYYKYSDICLILWFDALFRSDDHMPKRLHTVGELALEADVPVHRVTYWVRSRLMEPEYIAGGARAFSENQAKRILEGLVAKDCEVASDVDRN
jgi:MerR HTH family regulatory protein